MRFLRSVAGYWWAN